MMHQRLLIGKNQPKARMFTTESAPSLRLKAKLFRGFSDPSRLAILETVRTEARSVTEIVQITGLTQPNVSNHLACLLDCGLVEREQRGRFAFYELADPRVGRFLALGDEILSDVAPGVYVCPRYDSSDARCDHESE